MKKFLLMLLGVLLSLPAMARDFTCEYKGQTLTYTVIDEDAKTCEVASGKNLTGDLIIPPNVTDEGKEYNVTSIGRYAFYGCSSLTSVKIPESVTSIGRRAFEECTGLTRAEFASIESLCKIDFDIYWKFGVDYGYYELEANPLYYANHLYINGREVTEVIIPESVTSIGRGAFIEGKFLTSIIISEGVTSIGEFAFYNCDNLSSVIIPGSITSIGESAFFKCTGLTKAEFASIEALCRIKFHGNTSNPLYFARHLYINGEEATELTIPESVTSIGNYTFAHCSGLTSVTIPEGVTSIGEYAFSG
ncbi:MAG: leucine-rich repeat domain-containing protein [Muribaculaceae bacterium]|nr:leucine-rich repeat domain-containing protein [Muribaculaceae bacterium]